MNCEVCELKELEVEYFEIREVLRCILHTIVFHRALGLVRPKDIDCELFEITYIITQENVIISMRNVIVPHDNNRKLQVVVKIDMCTHAQNKAHTRKEKVQCGDAVVEKKIEEKIDEFINKVEKHPNRKSQICLSFYEVKNNKATWFSNKVERLFWEQWYINLHVINPKAHGKSHHNRATTDLGGGLEEQTSRHAALESSLREVLFQIIRFVNEKKDHLPPIPIQEGISFPYEITILSSSDSSFGWHTDVLKRMLQTGHPTMIS